MDPIVPDAVVELVAQNEDEGESMVDDGNEAEAMEESGEDSVNSTIQEGTSDAVVQKGIEFSFFLV